MRLLLGSVFLLWTLLLLLHAGIATVPGLALRPGTVEVDNLQATVGSLQHRQLEQLTVVTVCAERHVIDVDHIASLRKSLRIGAWEGFGVGAHAVDAAELVVGEIQLLEFGGKGVRETERGDLVVGEVETDQLGAQAGQVLWYLGDIVV